MVLEVQTTLRHLVRGRLPQRVTVGGQAKYVLPARLPKNVSIPIADVLEMEWAAERYAVPLHKNVLGLFHCNNCPFFGNVAKILQKPIVSVSELKTGGLPGAHSYPGQVRWLVT